VITGTSDCELCVLAFLFANIEHHHVGKCESGNEKEKKIEIGGEADKSEQIKKEIMK
jgi:hypothetical protein